MRVLITGAAGVLGSSLARVLSERHQVRTTDMVAVADAPDFRLADLTDADQARAVVEDIEVVVHAAAIHPWKPYTDDQYLDCNVKAVHHLLKACVAAKVRRVVYTSSIAAVGYGPYAEHEMPVREEQTPQPNDLYGLTKQLGEATCRLFQRRDGLPILCLRPVTFIPRDPLTEGLYLATARGLPAEEIVRAHALAVETESDGFATAYLAPVVPYTPADVIASRQEPAAVIDRYYPGLSQLFASHGLTVPPMRFLFSTEQARSLLGWEARCSIEDWYAAARTKLPTS